VASDRAPVPEGGRPDGDRRDAAPANGERTRRHAGDPAMMPGEVLATHTLNLEAGKSYTIVLTGRVDGGKRQLDALVVEDMVPAEASAATE